MEKKPKRAKSQPKPKDKFRPAQFQVERILDSVSDSFVALDTEWRYTYVNEKAAQTFGRTREQLIGKHIWTEFPEGVDQPFYKAYYKAVETQQPVFLEEYYPPYDRWFENRIYPSKDGLSIFFHDITDRKKAELALQEQERLTSAIVDTTPALIYVYDMESQSNVYSNAGMEQLLGFSTKDIQAMGAEVFVRLIHPDDLQKVIDFQSKMMMAKDAEILELEYRMKDFAGGWHTLHSYERPFVRNTNGSLKQKLGVAIDITERKRAETLMEGEKKILEMIARGETLSQILDAITRSIEAQSHGLFCTILLLDPDGIHVRHGAAPSMPETFVRAIDGQPIGPNAGSCGTAAYRKEPVYVSDIASDPLWIDYREVALKHGLRACWSTPMITSDGKVLGTFAMYYDGPRSPEQSDLQLIELATHLTEIAIVRKRAQDELQRNEQVLRLFVENSPAAIAMFDRDMKYIVASRRYLIDYDLGEQDVVGRSHYDIFPEMPERWKEIHRRCLAGATERNEEDSFPRASGDLDWVRWEIRPWVERTGEIGGIILFSEVITERKRAEEKLNESEELWRAVFAAANDAIVLLDEKYNVAAFNEAAEKIYGRSLAGLNLYDLRAPETRGSINSQLQKAIQEAGARWETFHQRVDGTVFPVDVSTRTFEIGGRPNFVHIVRDITERKRAEDKIRRYLNQLTALNKAALQLQRLYSPQILAGEIIKSLEMILNYTYGAVLFIDESGGRLIPFALSAQKQGASFEEQDKRYIESADIRVGKGITGWVAQSGQSIRLGDVRQDKRYLGIRADIRSELCVPLMAGERVIGVINIESIQADAYSESDERVLETIAAQVSVAIQNSQLFEQVQQQTAELERRVLERTAQLSAANKELESFSYSVSHDLRAPLRAVSGFAEIIARRHRASLNEEGQHYFDNIIQASERMGHLIDDLLNYSRLGRAGVRLEPVSLAGVLAELTKDLKGHIDELHGTISITEGLPDVTGDKTLLNQIFTNLLENAVAYRKVDVPPQVEVTYQIEGEQVIVKVRDNGIGIPAEHQEKIFNIFQRLHSDDDYPGTGIGLATVRKSVELLGGSVGVESKAGEGSTFFVKLSKE
ncbi:MAG: PAS domain S-box protein [Chloroflexota bacterium]